MARRGVEDMAKGFSAGFGPGRPKVILRRPHRGRRPVRAQARAYASFGYPTVCAKVTNWSSGSRIARASFG